MFNIQEELKKLPQNPGVYIMRDKRDAVIYVGKAINLRSRVRQYFQHAAAQSPKVRNMSSAIASFEYIVTDNELEALILECNLIKQHQPKYNILLKDDKTYPFLKLTMGEPYPRLLITRHHAKDKARYFGPFKGRAGELLETVHKVWPIRSCKKHLTLEPIKDRPCLNYDIGQCKAPCKGFITPEAYAGMLDEVIRFLSGKSRDLIKKMEQEMHTCAQNLEFEKAAALRDKINTLKRVEDKQNAHGSPGDEQDVVAFAKEGDEAFVQIFFIRGGKMTGREHFTLNGADTLSPEGLMTEFIKRFYGDTTYIPKEIVVETDVEGKAVLMRYLSGIKGQNVAITHPQRGAKLKLAKLAANNAALTLSQFGAHMKREAQRTTGALMEIHAALALDPSMSLDRIEAYDISNIQGFESVGSMVVFEQGKPKRSDYRKFKIKTVVGVDDYASMAEVLTRRLLRHQKETGIEKETFGKLPDAIFIDGGAGQVSAAQKALDSLHIEITVCGMLKDEHHRTRGLYYAGREMTLPHASEGFKLLTRIQDEVHRFAIEYHRKLRQKNQVKSVLDDIPGIGPARRKALIKHFGDIHQIRDADMDALNGVPSMDKRSAEAVYLFFRK